MEEDILALERSGGKHADGLTISVSMGRTLGHAERLELDLSATKAALLAHSCAGRKLAVTMLCELRSDVIQALDAAIAISLSTTLPPQMKPIRACNRRTTPLPESGIAKTESSPQESRSAEGYVQGDG